MSTGSTETEWVQGPIIVGSGPSGIAVAACLSRQGIPSIVLEKSESIASLWKERTYDRLKLHLPKHFCNLPHLPFPHHFPKYPSKLQFVSYVESYADHFHVSPIFRQPVLSAAFDSAAGVWTVVTPDHRFVSRWLVAATGENADPFRPEIPGLDRFSGKVVHTSGYRSGEEFHSQRVLVVGCGNSGMEVSLDLCRNNALPHMVVRNSVHVLPREVLGFSTFGIAMALLKWLPMKVVDKVLLLAASLTLGNTDQMGLRRPKTGPMELKNATGKTPVLDVGAFSLIKSGNIKIMEGVKEVTRNGAKFVDGQEREFDSIVLATGYKSNVPTWLQGCDFFNKDDGMPRTPFPDGWKGENGLYTVGFTRRGLLGTSSDAVKIAEDIAQQWRIVNDECKTFSSPDSHIILLNKP